MGIFKRKKNRSCVLGLDGVPYPMLIELAKANVMPNTAKLLDSGHLHQMQASLPEISSVSWTDFMTGCNAGTHGIFGFTDLKKGSYDLRFPNYHDVKTPTLWDRLAQNNKKSVVINQPSTYPARKINGVLISGFVAIEMSKAVFPPALKSEIEALGYEIDIDTFKCRDNHDLLWRELSQTLSGREKAFRHFWEQNWDYFELIITGTDRLQHFLWSAYEDRNHPMHQNFLDYYHSVDHLIGEVASRFHELTGSEQGLYFLSDHGFTGIIQEVYLNTWLVEQGYLAFTTNDPQSLNDISPESRAFSLDPNRIYLHTEGKYPRGSVKSAEKSALKKEIMEKLSRLEYQNQAVIDRIFDCDEIYSGPWKSAGPDLIAVGNHGFDIKGSVKKKSIFGRSNLEGMHTWDEAFFWSVDEHGQGLKISDLSQIILSHMA